MALSNPITWNNMCTEFSLNPATAIWPASFYGKGGAPASGTLGFQDFVGRSSGAAFTPMPGTYSYSETGVAGGGPGASVTVTRAAGAAVWTYTVGGTSAASVTKSIASGGSAASITFELPAQAHGSRSAVVTLTQGANSWTLNLNCGGYLD